MDFDFTEDQREIRATARALLDARAPFQRVRACAEAGEDDAELWAELRTLGWPGIAVSEGHGGLGLGAVELAVLAEELGFTLAATPFMGTALAALALEQAGTAAQRGRWLEGLAAGELVGALGVARDGVADIVPDASAADVVVLVESGKARLLSRHDAQITPVVTVDPTRRYARVEGEGEPMGSNGAEILPRASVTLSAELVGVCQRALDMTVLYVKDRRQFGVPVGSFQAVSHRCAEMLLATEGTRSATYAAAWAADADPDGLALAAAVAKAAASDAGRAVTGSAIQAHGGIGFTWEADVHWLYKRAQLDAVYLGGAGSHRAAIAALIAAAPTAAAAGGPAPPAA